MSLETFCTKCKENVKLTKQVFLEKGGETGYKCKCGELYIDQSTIAKAALKWKEDYNKYPIYYGNECGDSEETIDINNLIQWLNIIGKDIEGTFTENNISYFIISGWDEDNGLKTYLYVPTVVYEYLIDNCPIIYEEIDRGIAVDTEMLIKGKNTIDHVIEVINDNIEILTNKQRQEVQSEIIDVSLGIRSLCSRMINCIEKLKIEEESKKRYKINNLENIVNTIKRETQEKFGIGIELTWIDHNWAMLRKNVEKCIGEEWIDARDYAFNRAKELQKEK